MEFLPVCSLSPLPCCWTSADFEADTRIVSKMAVHFSLPLTSVGKTAWRLFCHVHAAALCHAPWADPSGDYCRVHNANPAHDKSWDCSFGFKNHFELLHLCFAHHQGGKP